MLSDLFIYVKSVGKKGFKCIKKHSYIFFYTTNINK